MDRTLLASLRCRPFTFAIVHIIFFVHIICIVLFQKMINISDMNTITLFKICFAISALISTAEAIACSSTSSEWCWAWRIREIMKLDITGYSSTNATSCCSSAYGITCNGTAVTVFDVSGKGLFIGFSNFTKNHQWLTFSSVVIKPPFPLKLLLNDKLTAHLSALLSMMASAQLHLISLTNRFLQQPYFLIRLY